MSEVIDLRSYVSASNSRLLVMIDLQENNYEAMARDRRSNLTRSLENCASVIQHARKLGLPIAFTRSTGGSGTCDSETPSAWISGFEPKRSDMVFERCQPSCYANQLFDDVVSQIGRFAMAGLAAEQACLATAIDASHRGHHVAFLSDASASRDRRNTDASAVHVLTTKAIELFAEPIATRHWLAATSSKSNEHRYG